MQADSLLAEPQGKPKNIGVVSLSLLQRIFSQESNWCLLHCRWILYQLSSQGGQIFKMDNQKVVARSRAFSLESSSASSKHFTFRERKCTLSENLSWPHEDPKSRVRKEQGLLGTDVSTDFPLEARHPWEAAGRDTGTRRLLRVEPRSLLVSPHIVSSALVT